MDSSNQIRVTANYYYPEWGVEFFAIWSWKVTGMSEDGTNNLRSKFYCMLLLGTSYSNIVNTFDFTIAPYNISISNLRQNDIPNELWCKKEVTLGKIKIEWLDNFVSL